MNFWEFQGARSYCRSIVDELIAQKHAILILPQYVYDKDPFICIREILHQSNYGDLYRIDIGQSVDLPEYIISQAHNQSCDGFEKPTDILYQLETIGRFIWVDGISSLPEPKQRTWSRFIKELAEQTQIDPGRFQLIVPLLPGVSCPKEDVKLAIYPWWGILSVSEVELFVEQQLCKREIETVTYFWNKSLCRGFAYNNPILATQLIEECPKTPEEICVLMKKIFQNAQPLPIFPKNSSRILSRKNLSLPSLIENQPNLKLWSEGMIDGCRERGFLLHPRLHADNKLEISRRLWHGQHGVLMPLVEEIRLSAVDRIQSKIGNNWQDKIQKQTEEKISTDIGRLFFAVLNDYKLEKALGVSGKQTLFTWKEIRNKIAHGDWVAFDALQHALKLAQAWLNI